MGNAPLGFSGCPASIFGQSNRTVVLILFLVNLQTTGHIENETYNENN